MKPNHMPKSNNRIRTQIVDGLITTAPSTWKKKSLAKDKDGKEKVETTHVTNEVLRFPLAQNVSDDSVERLARKWL